MGTGFGNNQYTSPIPWYVKSNFGGLVTKTPMERVCVLVARKNEHRCTVIKVPHPTGVP